MTVKLMGPGHRARSGCVLAAALVVASCGGGEQVSSFSADRILAFGDESSLIVDVNGDGNGRKYTINGVETATATVNCRLNAVWPQRIAVLYGLVFPQCNPGPTPAVSPTSRILATLGARAGDLAGQIDTQQNESAFRDGDMATVLVGLNDVIAQYAQYPSVSEETITGNVEAAGASVARQVNRLADAGVKVLLSTIPDAGVTPFARAEKRINLDTDRAALLTRLSVRFNASLRANLVNDGRRVGLVLLDDLTAAVAKFDGLNGFTNTSVGACDLAKSALVPPSILDCTDLTLIEGAGSNSSLWADDRHLSAGGQASLGSLAVQRAENNPF